MPQSLSDRLSAPEHDDELQALLDECVRDVRRSRSKISDHYETWDRNLDTYRSVRSLDPDDHRAKKNKEPVKQTVPLSYAQVNTFVTYLVLLYTQNPKVYELGATGDEDFDLRETSEKILAREVRNNQFTSLLVEFLLNVARMNLGVLKTSWCEHRFTPPVPTEDSFQVGPDGKVLEGGEGEPEEIIVKEGSMVVNISPYNFFPDMRLPMTRWREGQFAADETAFHISELKVWEKDGYAHGVAHVEAMSSKDWKDRGSTRMPEVDPTTRKRGKKNDDDDFMVCVTEMQKRLVPKDYGLGESKERGLWLVKIANDQRIIALEPMEDANMGFTYDVAQLLPDEHSELSDSLSTLIEELQEVISWLFNSRIASVRTNIERQLVVHPNFIELSDLQTRSPFIRAKKSAPVGLGVDKFISQLKTTDPTTTHLQDVDAVMGLMEKVSGVNGNAMGSFHSGRRSAAEAKNVASGAASRMKVHGATIWESALATCGKRMLTNGRQWLSFETFLKVIGDNEETPFLYDLFHRDNWWELVGTEDFFVYDGTSQNEKGFVAQSLQELALGLASNPQLLVATGIDLAKTIQEIQRLRGVDNLNRLKLTPDEQARQAAMLQPPVPGGEPQSAAGGGGPAGA